MENKEYEERISELETKKEKLERQIKDTEELISDLTQQNEKRVEECKNIKNTLKQLKANMTDIRISDHAIVRFLERVKGIDIEAIKEEILPEEKRKSFRSLSENGDYVINNHTIKIKNGVVATVI